MMGKSDSRPSMSKSPHERHLQLAHLGAEQNRDIGGVKQAPSDQPQSSRHRDAKKVVPELRRAGTTSSGRQWLRRRASSFRAALLASPVMKRLGGWGKARNVFRLGIASKRKKWQVSEVAFFRTKKLLLHDAIVQLSEQRRKQFYLELVKHVAFLALFFAVVVGQLPVDQMLERTLAVESQMESVLEAGTHVLQDTDAKGAWAAAMHLGSEVCMLLPSIHCTDCCSYNDSNAFAAYRMGEVRIRQVRVRPEMRRLFDKDFVVFPEFSHEAEERRPLSASGDPDTFCMDDTDAKSCAVAHLFLSDLSVLEPLHGSWLRLSRGRHGFMGLASSLDFGTGGYTDFLCGDQGSRPPLLGVGTGTRAIALEFSVVTPATPEFVTSVQFFCQLEAIGNAVCELRVATITVPMQILSFLFADSSEVIGWLFALWSVVTSGKLICFALEVKLLHDEFKRIRIRGLAKSMDSLGWAWVALEFARAVVLCVVSVSIFRFLLLFTEVHNVLSFGRQQELADEEASRGSEIIFADTRPLVVLYERITTWLSVAAFLYVLKIFRYLQLNASMYLLWHTIALAQFDLGTFLLMFTLVLIGYTVWGTLAFGFGSEGFSSLGASFWSCLDMLVGNFDYPELVRANSSVAPLFFLSFVLLVFLILVNVFIAIVSDNYDRAKNSIEENQDDHRTRYDLRDLCAQLIRALVPRVLPPKDGSSYKLDSKLHRVYLASVLEDATCPIVSTRNDCVDDIVRSKPRRWKWKCIVRKRGALYAVQ